MKKNWNVNFNNIKNNISKRSLKDSKFKNIRIKHARFDIKKQPSKYFD